MQFNPKPLIDYFEKNPETKEEFAKRCKIAEATLNRVLRGDGRVRITTLVIISMNLKIPLDNFFDRENKDAV